MTVSYEQANQWLIDRGWHPLHDGLSKADWSWYLVFADDRPVKPIAMIQWCKVKNHRCAGCKTPARSEPRNPLLWCCPKCEVSAASDSEMFEQYEEPPKGKKSAPVEPGDPTRGMSLKERMAFRKKAK